MAYTQDIGIALGKKKAGLSLKAQLVDSTAALIGLEITTGFAEIGGGNYLWHYEGFPDDFRGGVKILNQADNDLMAFSSINPVELGSAGLDNVPVDGMNARQAIAVQAAVLAGALTASGNTVTIKAMGNPATTRVVAITTTTGDRTVVTVTPPH